MAIEPQDRPQFFADSNDFASKAELFANNTLFCVMEVQDKDTKFGRKWHVEIFCQGEEELKTLTFSHSASAESKREQEFQSLSEHPDYLPIHACRLKMWSFEGKTGYRIAARSGGGPCPCMPETPPGDPFLPDFPGDIEN